MSISNKESSVLILMPTGRDAELVRSTLQGVGIDARACQHFDELLESISKGAGALLLAEEAIGPQALDHLLESLEIQPVWSDLPLIVFSSHTRNAEWLLETLGGRINVTIVER